MKPIFVYDKLLSQASSLVESVSADDLDDAQIGDRIAGRTVIVGGGDRLLGRLATAAVRYRPSAPTRFAPLGLGDFASIGRLPGGVGKVSTRIEQGRYREQAVPSLRIVGSAQQPVTLGFQFATGAMARLVESWVRYGVALGSVKFGMTSGTSDELAVTVNREPVPDAMSLHVCAVPDGWLRMTATKRPSFRVAYNDADVLKTIPSRRLRNAARMVGAIDDGFDVIHITHHSGYVVDGDIIGWNSSDVVQITVGPKVRILRG